MDLCLNMIVKDEAGVIADTLDNVLQSIPISHWLIHDTGSSDATREIIRAFFQERGIPGALHDRPWISFGENRNAALQDARGLSDYVLFFDADNRIEGKVPSIETGYDSYDLKTWREGAAYDSKLIVRNNGMFRWRGVVHEGLYLTSEFAGHAERTLRVDGEYYVLSQRGGARSRDASTYYRDAIILQNAIAAIGDDDRDLLPRYTFYCANSWKDADAPREAAHWYRERLKLGGWAEELYVSCFSLALQLEKAGDVEGAVQSLMQGVDICPDRVECLYHLARLHRRQGKFFAAMVFAESALKRPRQGSDRLFVDLSLYDYWLDFEYLFCLKGIGIEFREAPNYARFMGSSAPEDLKDSLA